MTTTAFLHEAFDVEWAHLEGVLESESGLFEFDETPTNLFWRISIFAEVEDQVCVSNQTLEDPAEYAEKYQLSHLNLSLFQSVAADAPALEIRILKLENWDDWKEYDVVVEKVSSIDWDEYH